MKLQHLAKAMLEAKSSKLPDEDNFYRNSNLDYENKLNRHEDTLSLIRPNAHTPRTDDEIELAISIFSAIKSRVIK